MSVATALVASTAISAGTAAYGASQQKKAGNAAAAGQAASTRAQLNYERRRASEKMAVLRNLIEDGMFEYPTVDAGAAADQSLGVTTRNLPGVLANTATTYDSAASNFSRYLNQAFGQGTDGEAALPNQQQAVNDAVLSALQGRLSEGTRTTLGRRALATGAVNLGRGAVQDTYTQQLGIAAEEQVQRGIQAYGQLYETYGRFAPQISPMDMLNYGGLSTNASLQNSQFNAAGQWSAQLAQSGALLGGFDQETAAIGRLVGPNTAAPYASQAANAIGSAEMAMQMGNAFTSALGTYASWNMLQNPSSLYGSSGMRPTQLPAAESAYNRRSGIEDYSASNYYLRNTGAQSGGGAALVTQSRDSLLAAMKELFRVK
jgi:hypothetical protein